MSRVGSDRGNPPVAHVYISPTVAFEDGSGTFSPVTSTLFVGERDLLLVDAQHMTEDVDRLGEMIAATGKRLRTIYVTHGHGDHYMGIDRLMQRFPGARAVSTRSVVDQIVDRAGPSMERWRMMFGDRVVPCDVTPEVLEGELELEGHVFKIIEVDQADITPSTIAYLPDTGVAVPGDLVYNRIHVMLGFCSPSRFDRWLANIDALEQLKPSMIVCGHRTLEASDFDVARILDETRGYIRAFAEEAPRADGPSGLISKMTELFPAHGNPWTLQFSANAYFERSARERAER